MKLIIASLMLFFCNKKWFDRYIQKYYEEDYNLSNFDESTNKIRKNLRRGLWTNLFFFVFIILFVWWHYHPQLTWFNGIKVLAAYLALTVTLGRGGWAIQTFKGSTLPERIDNTIYRGAQYINVIILLITIYHPK
ncbi:TPA: hypothetical protein I8149_000986 [Citrobacter freundii]|nr:hypothetical protein [Citrobacter freundii]HAT2484127.1 hypothetical protein [Citrobacter freundii]HAT2717364.1 hypothetical protein [Citrobacter freundii]HAT2727859.1 hypothetical protein [Citrobacter freundii]HBC0511750.1 hypothetical protein [Citrobacter freundii]